MSFKNRWVPSVSVEQRRANAAREVTKLSKNGRELRPIHITSPGIATSFWGIAWCKNLEIYADWANRMPRGRSYARNGSIVDLQIESGKITALVSGSSLYRINISIDPLSNTRWQAIRKDCAQQVRSLMDLMRGKLPESVLARLTDPKEGIFPNPKELKLQCSCPDYATMCKHIAATLYGVGHLLDSEPGLFFEMRGVDQKDLLADAMKTQTVDDAMGLNQQSDLAGEDLSAIFGIDLASTSDLQSATSSLQPSKTTKKRVSSAKAKAKPKRKAASSNTASISEAAPTNPNPKAKRAKKAAKKVAKKATKKATKKVVKSPNVRVRKKSETPSHKKAKPGAKQNKR